MRDDRVYLMHIQDSLREVRQFIEGESYESFLENRMMQNAVMLLSRSSERPPVASVPSSETLTPRCRGG